jgi:hypothetical protein
VELFGRAAVAGGRTRQRAVAARLDELVAAGHVADLTTHSWHGRVRTPVDADGPVADAVAWYDRFVAWADRNGATVEPFFGRHERESTLTDTTYEEYVFPVLAVAVVRDDEVTEVAPRRTCTGDRVDVRDVVERLGATAASDADAAPPAVAGE